ncbi:MAG: acyl-CoA desaturase [Sporichthya sp.]|nr:acyl-CoA desaturase [Sporichthya sp.]
MRESGLLRPRRVRYAVMIGTDLIVLALIWIGVYALGRSWWALFLAVPAAVFTTRVMFIGHDAGHRQVARTARVNRLIALVVGDLITGVGSRWWVDKHNRHHANPNVVGRDPDVDPGALVWTSEQVADRRTRFSLWASRHQARLFFPLLLAEALNLTVTSFLAARRGRDRLLLCLHIAVYFGGLALMLGPGRAAVFVLIHQGLLGLHLGCSFAPNHKGMPMSDPETRQDDFLRKQVLTSRNVTGGRATDWLLGGLNYQIEHHLFPSMPRPNLRHAQSLVRAHCAALGVSYAEAPFRTSMAQALRHLDTVDDIAVARGSGDLSANRPR